MFCDSVLFSLYSLLKPWRRPPASLLKYGIAVLMISLPQILPSSVHSSHCCQSNLSKTQIWSHQLLCLNSFKWITSGPRIKSKLLSLKAVYAPAVCHLISYYLSQTISVLLQLWRIPCSCFRCSPCSLLPQTFGPADPWNVLFSLSAVVPFSSFFRTEPHSRTYLCLLWA